MSETLKEVIGFLSRWLLLAVVAGGGALFVWSAAMVGSGAGAEADVVLSDAIWRPWRSVYASGYLLPYRRGTSGLFITTAPGRRPRVVLARGYRFAAGLPKLPAGRNHIARRVPSSGEIHSIRVKGLPYGSYAFRSAEAICAVVPPGESVFAVDVRLIVEPPSGSEEALAAVLRGMNSRGQVAMFYAGQPQTEADELAQQYRLLRRRIRADYPKVPVVFTIESRYHVLNSLRHMAWTLSRGGGGKPIVITASPNLADAAAREGFDTHLIASQPAGERARKNLTRHESLGDLADWLAWRDEPAASS